MRKARLISAFLALFATAAEAGPVEDGFAAYARGDFSGAVALWRPYAENGDARAQNFMGDLYFAGQGVNQDFRQALFWFKLAAGKGSAAARYNLGVAAEQGRGLPASRPQAMSWYKQAAEKGNVPAMLALARLARASDPPDDEAAARWTQKAAETGDPQAQDELGTLYRLGKGVEPDLARAREWYRKAGEQGYAPAENNLGMMYRLGAGGPRIMNAPSAGFTAPPTTGSRPRRSTSARCTRWVLARRRIRWRPISGIRGRWRLRTRRCMAKRSSR